MNTFEALQKSAAELGTVRDTLGERVDAILDSARVNADDTVHVEKTPDADWNEIAISSAVELLSYSMDAEVIAWFAGHGITA